MKTKSTNFISVLLSQRQSKISQRKHIKIGPLNEPWAYQFISRIESTSEQKAKHILELSNSTTMYKKIDKLYGGAGRRFEIWRGKVPCLSLFVSSIQVKGIVVFFFHTHKHTKKSFDFYRLTNTSIIWLDRRNVHIMTGCLMIMDDDDDWWVCFDILSIIS